MATTSLPRVFAQLLAASGLSQPDPWTILITGQIGTGGTATSGQPENDLQDKTNTEIESLFGANSEMTGRILRARAEIQGRVPITAIGLTPAAGTAATFDIAVTGTAAEDGKITLKIIDSFLYTITVDVLSGDIAADVATAIKAKIDALERLPATNSILSGTVTLTASDVGTIPNKYTVEVSNVPAGLTIPSGQFTGGATDPTNTTIFDNVQSTRFHSISWPWQDDFTAVKTFLEGRNVINNAFLHGVAFIGLDDTEANIKAKVNGVTPLNSPNLVFMGNRAVTGVSQVVTPPDWRVTEFISIEALRQTPDVPIGKYITVATPGDSFGNPGLASLAYYNTPLGKTSITIPEKLFSDTAQDNLKEDGFSIIGINESSTSMITGEVVSTYKFNTRGDPDVSFKYLNYIRTGYLALEIFFKTLKAQYSQFRLTGGDVIAGRAMTNATLIKAKYNEIYLRLSGPEFVLTQAGQEAQKYFSENLTITADIANGQITSFGQLPIVTQGRGFLITFQSSFTIG